MIQVGIMVNWMVASDLEIIYNDYAFSYADVCA